MKKKSTTLLTTTATHPMLQSIIKNSKKTKGQTYTTWTQLVLDLYLGPPTPSFLCFLFTFSHKFITPCNQFINHFILGLWDTHKKHSSSFFWV